MSQPKAASDPPYQPFSSSRPRQTISVLDLTTDLLTPIATKYWPNPTSYQSFTSSDITSLIDTVYYTELINADASNPSLGLLDLTSYLENFLWPTFDPSTSSYPHIMSIILLINTKLDSLPHLNIWEQLLATNQTPPSNILSSSNTPAQPPSTADDNGQSTTTTHNSFRAADESKQTTHPAISNDKKLQSLLKTAPLLEHCFQSTPPYLLLEESQQDTDGKGAFLTTLLSSRPLPAPLSTPLTSLRPLHKAILPQERLTILTFLHYAFRALEHPIIRSALLPFISVPLLRWISPQFVPFDATKTNHPADVTQSPSYILNDGKIVYETTFHELLDNLSMKSTFNKINEKIFTAADPIKALRGDRFIAETIVIPHLLLKTINSIKYLTSPDVISAATTISSSIKGNFEEEGNDRNIGALLDLIEPCHSHNGNTSSSDDSSSSDSSSSGSDSDPNDDDDKKTSTSTTSNQSQNVTTSISTAKNSRSTAKQLQLRTTSGFLSQFIGTQDDSIAGKLLGDAILRGFVERISKRTRFPPQHANDVANSIILTKTPIRHEKSQSRRNNAKDQRNDKSKRRNDQNGFKFDKKSEFTPLSHNALPPPTSASTIQQDIQYLQQCLFLHRSTLRNTHTPNISLSFHRTLLHSIERTLSMFTDLLSNVDSRKFIFPLINAFHLIEQSLFLPFLSHLTPSIADSIRLQHSSIDQNDDPCTDQLEQNKHATQLTNLLQKPHNTASNPLQNPYYDQSTTFQFNLGGINLIVTKLDQAKTLMLQLEAFVQSQTPQSTSTASKLSQLANETRENRDLQASSQPTSLTYVFTNATKAQLNTFREALSDWLHKQYFAQKKAQENILLSHQHSQHHSQNLSLSSLTNSTTSLHASIFIPELPPFQIYQLLSRISYYLNFNVQLRSPEPRSTFTLIAEYEEKLKRVQVAIRQAMMSPSTPSTTTSTVSNPSSTLTLPQNEIFFAPSDPTAIVNNTSPELIALKRLLVAAKLSVSALESIIRSLGLFIFHPSTINMATFHGYSRQHDDSDNGHVNTQMTDNDDDDHHRHDNSSLSNTPTNSKNLYYTYLSYLLITYLTPPPNPAETTKNLPIYPTTYPIDTSSISTLSSIDHLQPFFIAATSSPLPSAQLQYLTLHDLFFTSYYLQRQEVAFGLVQHIYSTVFHGLRPVLRFNKELKAVNNTDVSLKDLFKLDAMLADGNSTQPATTISSLFSAKKDKYTNDSDNRDPNGPVSKPIIYSIDFIRDISKVLDLTRFDSRHDGCYILPRNPSPSPISVHRNHHTHSVTAKITVNFDSMTPKQFNQWFSVFNGSILYLASVIGSPTSPSFAQQLACPNLAMLRGCEVTDVLDEQGISIPVQVQMDAVSDQSVMKSLQRSTRQRTFVVKLDYTQHEQDIEWIASGKSSIPPHLFANSHQNHRNTSGTQPRSSQRGQKLSDFGKTPLLPGFDHYFGPSMIPISPTSLDTGVLKQDERFYSLFNVVVNLGPDRSQFKPLLTALRKTLKQFETPQGISSTIPKWILYPVLGYKLNNAHYSSLARSFHDASLQNIDQAQLYNPHDSTVEYGDAMMLFKSQLACPMQTSRFSTTFHSLEHIKQTVPELVFLDGYGEITHISSNSDTNSDSATAVIKTEPTTSTTDEKVGAKTEATETTETTDTMNDSDTISTTATKPLIPAFSPPYLVDSHQSLAYLDGSAYQVSSHGKRGYISRNHTDLLHNPEAPGVHGKITVSIPSPLSNQLQTTTINPNLAPINSMLSQPIYFPYFFLQLQSQHSATNVTDATPHSLITNWTAITDAFKYTFQAYLPKLSQDHNLASRPYWNSSQVESIRSALHNGLTLVQGPAGCGKSATLVQITNELIYNNPSQRILILTHSNSGIDELLLRILRDTGIDSRYVLRLGHRHADLSKKLQAEQQKLSKNLAAKNLPTSTTVVEGGGNGDRNRNDMNDDDPSSSQSRGRENNAKNVEPDGRSDFSSRGRSEYLSKLTSQLLSMINYLFATFPADQRGGSSCIDTCYTAMNFYQKIVVPVWNKYMVSVNDFELEAEQDGSDDSFIKAMNHLIVQFPFLMYYQATVGQYSSLGVFIQQSTAENADNSHTSPQIPPKTLYQYNKQLVLLYFAFIQYLFLSIQELQPLLTIPLGSQRNNFIQGQYARIFGATVAHLISQREHISNLRLSYDTVLIEEAGQLLDINTLLSIFSQQQRSNQHYLKRLIMIGDTYQLPPLVQNLDLIRQASFGQSLFSRFLSLGAKFITLDQQGRAHPTISRIWKWIYAEGSTPLQDLPQTYKLAPRIKGFCTNASCWVLKEGTEERVYGTNIKNSIEADYTAHLFIYLLLQGYLSSEIAIVVAYREQVSVVEEQIKQLFTTYSYQLSKINPAYTSRYYFNDNIPRVSTIDQFQGQQADIILLSFVRTESVGYLRDLRRLLVAFSRARIGLFTLVHENLLKLCPTLHGFVGKMNPQPFLPLLPTQNTILNTAPAPLAIQNLDHFKDHINSTY